MPKSEPFWRFLRLADNHPVAERGESHGLGALTGSEERKLGAVLFQLGALCRGAITRESNEIDWEGIRKRIAGADESGQMTREEADAKNRELREEMGRKRSLDGDPDDRGSRRITREDYARVEAELKKAVESGRISQEDAQARLEGMRKMMAEQVERKRE